MIPQSEPIPMSPEMRAFLEDDQRRRIAAATRSRRRAIRLPLIIAICGLLSGLALFAFTAAMGGLG